MMEAGTLVLDDNAVAGLLPRIDLRTALREMFGALAAGQAIQPPQTSSLFPQGGGDFIGYLGVLARERVFGVKVSPYIAAPRATHGATDATDATAGTTIPATALVTAWTLLMSMDTGRPLMLCDSKRLTTERTAATTALAVDLLAPASAQVLCVVGSGPVARAHVRHALALRAWREIRVHSRGIGRLPWDAAREWAAIDKRVSLRSSLVEATAGADVVMLCTSSGTPVVNVQSLAPHALVTSISTNAPGAHEIAPAALASMDVYCDYRATTPSTAGEMRMALATEGWKPDSIRGDLPELVEGTALPPQGDRRVFFRSVGLGLEDVVAAHRIYLAHALQAAGAAA